MALFSFGKKKQQREGAPGNPIEQIMVMKQRGMDNNQIIQELERQGYNSSQIFDALNQTNLPSQNFEQPAYGQQEPSYEQYPNPPQAEQQKEDSVNMEQIEEIAEAIIDEKWKEFEEDVKKIIDWKEKTEIKVNQLDQQIKDLANALNSLHKNLLNKVSDYDKNITDVGIEIKAMEKVFQKILPSLTENVNKLERMAKPDRN